MVQLIPQSFVVLCGDFNGLRESYDNVQVQTDLVPIVDFGTRNDNTLDQIFTNIPCITKPTALPPIGSSDHSLVLWNQHPTSPHVKTTRHTRLFSPCNKANKFSCMMHWYDWNGLAKSENDIEKCVALFQNCLKAVFDLCFPLRSIRVNPRYPPWITTQLKVLINDSDS